MNVVSVYYYFIPLYNTLSKISNRSLYSFTLVLEVRFCYTKFILLFIDQGFAETLLTGASCTDDARVKVPSFISKVTFSTILNIPQRRYPFVLLIV